MSFKMSNKIYDILRWVDTIVLPAAMTFFGVIANAINLGDITPTVLAIGSGLIAFLGAILGISNNQYQINKLKEETDEKC